MKLERWAIASIALALVSTAGPGRGADEPAAEPVEQPGTEQPAATTHTPISQATDYDEVVVTAAPHARRRFDVVQGTAILSQEELERAIQPSLGETLAELPGVSSTYYGPGASRPVIRGLDGPRIRVLQNGVGTLDASVTSPDHAVVSDPLAADRIEIIRGAGTLLYGSSAIGGVVNVDDGRIPDEVPSEWVDGDLRALYGSASEEKAAGAGVTAGRGPLALRASGHFRSSNDMRIPGHAISDELRLLRPDLPPDPHGRAPGTSTDSRAGTLGASLVGDVGLLGFSYGANHSNYGVPAEPGELVRIDLRQTRWDARARLDREWLIFEETAAAFGHASYEHQELEDEIVPGTLFENRGYEGRLELVQKPWRELHGSIGFQALRREFSALGEEAFTPPNETTSFGLFAVEEYHLGAFTLEAGLRYERLCSEALLGVAGASAVPLGIERRFDLISFSAGAGWTFLEDYLVGFSLSRTERAPAAEELYSNGPHLATAGFDLGSPLLGEETGLTIELTARKRRGRLSGGVNLYYTFFDDFIFAYDAGFVDDTGAFDPAGELMLRRFIQSDARYLGGELTAALEALQLEYLTGVLDVSLDWVKAQADDYVVDGAQGFSSNDRIPRVPPLRVKGGVELRSERADLRFETWWVSAQERVGPYELPTDSHLMLNLILTLHPFPDLRNVTIIAQGRNLTDAEARVHSSFLKDRLPLPGREVRVGMRVAF